MIPSGHQLMHRHRMVVASKGFRLECLSNVSTRRSELHGVQSTKHATTKTHTHGPRVPKPLLCIHLACTVTVSPRYSNSWFGEKFGEKFGRVADGPDPVGRGWAGAKIHCRMTFSCLLEAKFSSAAAYGRGLCPGLCQPQLAACAGPRYFLSRSFP